MHSIQRLSRIIIAIALLFLHSCSNEEKDTSLSIPLFSPPVSYPDFSGSEAFSFIEAQVAFGPRAPGSRAHAECRDYFLAYFKDLNIRAELQQFSLPGYNGESLHLSNIVATVNPDAKRRILLAAHWDSRPWADMETAPELQSLPIPGANDGGSGVAVLLEAARHFAHTPPSVGVDIVLFDGEDYGRDGDESMFCLGSKYYAATHSTQAPLFGIVLDLVGDQDAEFPQEQFSRKYAGDIVKLVWDAAETLALPRFVRREHSAVIDDHVSLNTVAGIKTIDIIDAELVGHDKSSVRRQYWHTHADTPDQCSAKTLEDVGRLILYITYGVQGDSNNE